MASSAVKTDAAPKDVEDVLASRPTPMLRARTLELLWHFHERNEEAGRFGLVQAAQTPEGVLSIDYTATEGGRLVTTGGDMSIRVWKVDEAAIASWLADTVCDMTACCRFMATMRTSWMPLTARWSPHGQMIASAHCEGKICLWWRDQNSAVNYREANAARGSSSSSPNTAAAAAGETDLIEEEWKDYRHLTGHISDVHDLCFSPDSRYLLSGAGDGSIVIHDLDASSMPIVQLTDLHSKFCRGVSWDPWGRYIHTFGASPALHCFTVVPRREKIAADASSAAGGNTHEDGSGEHNGRHGHHGRRVRQLQLVNQRRCQGDFIGESCALSFRRLDWSPDGTLLAVPFGKVARATTATAAAATTPTAPPRKSTEDIFAAIDARAKGETAVTVPPTTCPAAQDEEAAEKKALFTAGEHADQGEVAPLAEDMLHCVQIFARGAMDAPAARLTVRGFSEIRGVQWAPCFLSPVFPSPYVAAQTSSSSSSSACAHVVYDAEAPLEGMDVMPASTATASANNEDTPARTSAARTSSQSTPPPPSSSPTHATPAAEAPRVGVTVAPTAVGTSVNGKATVIPQNPESWSLSDYRMALAVWTADAVVVYTTDQVVRHSDFTDLHILSITDVTWNASATYLFTAALDGYVSVISMGDSLTLVHRLPSFSTRPMTQRLVSVLEKVQEEGLAIEKGRVARREASRLAAEASARASREAGDGVAGGEAAVAQPVVVVRKKKKVEAKPVSSETATEVQIDQLAALMTGL